MIPLPAKLIGAAALVALTWFALNQQYNRGYAAAEAVMKAQSDAAIEEARSRGEAVAALATERANQLAAELEAEKQNIKTVVETVEKEIPVYVTEEADRTYPLSVGWVRVHDRSASGGTLAPAAIYPGRANDEAAPVRASESAAVIARNYGACLTNAAHIEALQEHIRNWESFYADIVAEWPQ